MSRYSVGDRRMAAADRFVLSLAVLPALGLLVTSAGTWGVVVLALAVVAAALYLRRRRR